MNEINFLWQILFVLVFSYGAFRLGKAALTTSVILQAILANLFVLKQTTLFGLEVTSSDAFVIGSLVGLNLLREFYDAESAKKATTLSAFFLVFFLVMGNLHLKFFPGPHDTAHFAYHRLLSHAPRLIIASLVTFYIVQRLEIRLFGWISRILPRSHFSTRTSISIGTTQLLDTLLFSFLGLYRMVAHLLHIIIISFLIKTAVLLAMNPLLLLFSKLHPTRQPHE